MFRSVGSILFGIASDRYGRKWPFVVNNLLFIVLELVRALRYFPCSLPFPPHGEPSLADEGADNPGRERASAAPTASF